VGSVVEDGKCVPAPACEGVVLYGGDCGAAHDLPVAEWNPIGEDAGAIDAGADASLETLADAAQQHDACDGRCDGCQPGMARSMDGDGCVSLCASDEAPTCGQHGECVVDGDDAVCECDRGYAGEACGECAPQFSERDDGEDCVPDCGDCGAHAFCDTEADVPECECARGYADGGDDQGCRWLGGGEHGGGLRDEALNESSAWTTRHVALEDGAATFASATVDGECELGVLAQSFDKPEAHEAERFELDLELSTTCAASDADECPPLLVEVGEAVTRVQVPGRGGGVARRTVALCLGESAYGDDVNLRIRPGLARARPGQAPAAFDCDADAWPAVEAVRIRPAAAAECDDSDAIVDGTLALSRDQESRVQVVFPSPTDVPSPALEVVRSSASPTGTLEIAIDGLPWAYALTTEDEWSFCLPDWAHGQGHELRLIARNAGVTLSRVAFVSEPACGDGRFDAGFERGQDAEWAGRDGSWSIVPGAGYPKVETDAARTGSRGLRLTDIAASLLGLLRIPEATDQQRPAIALHYRVNGATVRGQMSTITPLGTAASTLAATAWSLNLGCLGPAWEAQLVAVQTTVAISGGAAGIDVDDLGPVLSERCP
jgi:hypothetical protein